MKPGRFLITVLGLVVGTTSFSGCSTDSGGLGSTDGGGTGGRGSGSGGSGTATGGAASGTGGGATSSGGATASGGAVGSSGGAMASGGAVGSSGGAMASGGGAVGSSGGATASGGATGRGGAGSGGRLGSGGASSGGSGTGGRGGSGGSATGGRGSGGAGGVKPECTTAADCKLVSDCCTCAAMLTGQAAPACSLVCIQSKCAAQQLPAGGVACVAGRCVAGFNCDASKVTCKIAVPVCAAGEVPGVNEDGTCYVGGCVPATQCKSVTSCAACAGPGEACATNQSRGSNQAHCVTVPAACGGAATCACLGPTTCVSPFNSCNDASGVKGVLCGCPTC